MAQKSKVTLEYLIPCNASTLYGFLKSDSGLSGWFADKVVVEGTEYSFYWGKFPNLASLVSFKENRFVRFVWQEDIGNDYYFEMAISIMEVTGVVSLIITDFSDDDEIKNFWDSGIKKLKRKLGVV